MMAIVEQEQNYLSSKLSSKQYTKFLEALLASTNRIRVQQACCRQIIKFFTLERGEHEVAKKSKTHNSKAMLAEEDS